MQFLQLQQQAGSISTKNSLSCQNPESPTPGQFFQQKHLKEQTQISGDDGDSNFDEEFLVEKIKKVPMYMGHQVQGYKDGTKKQNSWSQ